MKCEATEKYLRRATRGVWGKKRLEVREELAAHLYERVMAHRIAGLGETDAVEKALLELGKPKEVSVGMAKLYTLPTVMGSSLALITVCLAFVALWPKGSAQTLQGTFSWPTQECISSAAEGRPELESSKCKEGSDDFWVSNKELQNVLEPQGVEFEKAGFQADILKVTVPGATPFFIEANPYINIFGVGTIARGYLSMWNIVERFSALPTGHVKISGWGDPAIQLNEVSFRLQEGTQPVQGRGFYLSYLMAVINEGFGTDFYEEPSGDLNLVLPENFAQLKPYQQRASLQVGRGPGNVYGLLTYYKLPNPEGAKEATLGFQLARTTDSGELRVWLPKEATTFVDSFAVGDKLKLGQSILISLAGGSAQKGGWYEIISPEKIAFASAP